MRGRLFGDDGQGVTEYALVLVLFALLCLITLTLLGHQASDPLNRVANSASTVS